MTRGERITHCALGALTAAAFAVLYAPILLVCLLSFFPVSRHKIDWAGASVAAYGQLFENRDIFDALLNTFMVGGGTVIVSLSLGLLLAYRASRRQAWDTRLIEFVIFLPFLLPPIITGLSLLTLFQEIGIDRNLVTVAIGHILFVLALVYRMLLTRLRSLGPSIVEASQDLGASPWQTFRYVILPGMRSALVTSAVLVFALSFDETLISVFLSGGDSTLPIRLWAMIRVGFSQDINALVTVILLGSVVMTVSVALLMRSRRIDAAE